MKTYEKNLADTALIVKSLTVLENIEGGGLYEIRKSADAAKRQAATSAKQVEKYWESLTDDGVITPIEKQSLKREMANIERSESAITTQAATMGYSGRVLDDYVATYEDLHEYIFETLRLFDDMESATTIDDRDEFNALFSNYFYSESFVLLAITQGILDTINIRVLTSLNESGEEGETALYHGGLYQYTDGRWKAISTGNYKGAKDELPAPEEDSFFLASDDFTTTDNLIVNGTELLVNGTELLITRAFIKGYIYYVQEGVFYVETDKTNWRYAAAFADVLNVTGELPQIFQDGLDALQEQIDANAQAFEASLQDEITARQNQFTVISGDIVRIDDDIQDIVDRANAQQTEIEKKIEHLPVYLGPQLQDPTTGMKDGDFYLYTGNGEDSLKVRRYNVTQAQWQTLDPENSLNNSYYQIVLPDILAGYPTTSATFGAVFAENIIANSAAMNQLSVKTIYLRQTGAMQSDNTTYVEESVGYRVDADGNIDANGNAHFGASGGKKVAIGVPLLGNPDFNNYDVVIGGNTKIKGVLDGVTGKFSVLLDCGVFKVLTADLNFTVLNYELSQKSDVRTYLMNKFGNFYSYSGPVSGIYGPNTYIKVGNEIYENIVIEVHESRAMMDYIYTYDPNTPQERIEIWQASGSAGVTINMYYPFIIQYVKESGNLMYGFDLPTSDPHVDGLIWNNNGTLKLSSSS